MRPLVVGYPRSGFTLLISVLSELIDIPHDRHTRSLKTLCDTAGLQISRRIEAVFRRRGLVMEVSDVAEEASAIFNTALAQWIQADATADLTSIPFSGVAPTLPSLIAMLEH